MTPRGGGVATGSNADSDTCRSNRVMPWRVLNGYLLPALVVGLSAALLWVFSNIWRVGSHHINEPNTLILILETVLLGVALVYGVVNFVILCRKPGRK